MGAPPPVSVILPARNAATSLGETLDSLLAQTSPDWEAIVVDDGSTDETVAVAASYVRRDGRIRLAHRQQGGEGAARNVGVELAAAEWLLFLDADDWLAESCLERLTHAIAADPSADAIYSRWTRVTPAGELLEETYTPDPASMFPTLARFCAFAIHSCVVRRRLVVEVGGFDASLRTCADWDLWQRVARMGARFARIPDVLAYYRLRPDSASANARQVLSDGLRVIDQGHSRDPRVPRPHPAYAPGIAHERLSTARLGFVCWPAALLLAGGEDVRATLTAVAEDIAPDLEARDVAASIFRAVLVSARQPPGAWPTLWPTLECRLDDFLAALEAQAKAPGLARRSRTALERLVVEHAFTGSALTIGRTHAARVEITKAIPDVHLPTPVERLRCAVSLEGEPLGTLELPVCDGLVPARVLADAIAAEFFWVILGRFFEHSVYPGLRVDRGPDGVALYRESVRLCEGLPLDGDAGHAQVHAHAGWTIFLQELWGRPDWPGERFYDDSPTAQRHGVRGAAWRSIAHAIMTLARRLQAAHWPWKTHHRWPVIEVSRYPAGFERAAGAAAVEVTVGGASLGAVPVSGPRESRSAHHVLTTVTGSCGVELCRLAVRQAVLGAAINAPGSLRTRLTAAAARRRPDRPTAQPPSGVPLSPTWGRAVAQALPPPERGVVLARHALGAVGTSASRHAALPAETRSVLLEAAAVAGEHAVAVEDGEHGRVLRVMYAPDLLWPGAGSPAADASERQDPGRAAGATTERLPILLYHRVAPTGAPETSRYRVTPNVFEAQVRYLAEGGYQSIGIEEWRCAKDGRRPLPGRAVLFTFDDGYQDFATYAWPILQRYGFSATVFLVADRIGGTNAWDAVYGERLPLLSWEEVRRLRDAGVTFGSHTATHHRLTGLSPADVVLEAARSRATIQRGLDRPVTSLAYPHGAEDSVVRHLVGACGYLYGFSCRPGRSRLDDPLLALPRIEVTGSDTPDDFIAKVTPS